MFLRLFGRKSKNRRKTTPTGRTRDLPITPLPEVTLSPPLPLATTDKVTECDKEIIGQYPWNTYISLPAAAQEALELCLLKEVVRRSHTQVGGIKVSIDQELCSSLLHTDHELRALLLRCWEAGCFQDLRADARFISIARPEATRRGATDDSDITIASPSPNPNESINDQSPSTELPLLNPFATSKGPSATPVISNTEERSRDTEANPEAPDVHATARVMKQRAIPQQTGGMGPLWADNGTYSIYDSTFNDMHFNDLKVTYELWQIFHSENHEPKVSEWLSPVEYSGVHNDIRRKRAEDTGTWFIQSKSFLDWCSNPFRRVLWCPGIPGVGKTVIASLAIDYLREQRPDSEEAAVIFVYFNYKSQSEQNLSAVIQSLCRQLHEICRAIKTPSAFEALYVAHMKHKSRPSVDQLQTAFGHTAEQFRQVYVVLDALDEYLQDFSNYEVQQLLQAVLALENGIKILVTSRIIGQMESTFEELGAVREEVIASSEDLHQYLKAGVAGLKRFEISANLSHQVIEKVQEAAQGRFLMAELHMKSLVRYLTAGDLEDALDDLPDEIDLTYAMAMDRIKALDESLQELAFRTIMWATRCARPMRLEELQHALAMKKGRTDISKYLPTSSTITSACAGLVIIENQRVGFVHLTAQEFFETRLSTYFTQPDRGLALTCLHYLILPCFSELSAKNMSGSCRISDIERIYPLYHYASINWGYHAFLASLEDIEDTFAQTVLSILEDHISVLHLSLACILQSEGREIEGADDGLPDGTGTGLFLSLFHLQTDALLTFFEEVTPTTIPITRQRISPYLFAARMGHAGYIRMMLDRWSPSPSNREIRRGDTSPNDTTQMVDITTPDAFGNTPLLVAAIRGHENVVELLLQHARPVSQDDKHMTSSPLLPECDNDNQYPNISHLHPDINSRNNDGATALFAAALHGHASIVEILLSEKEINVNMVAGDNHDTALTIAADAEQWSVMKHLLGHPDTNVNTQNLLGHTALILATFHGHEPTVKLLLDHPNIDTELSDKDGWTPLILAASYGHTSIVELLLSHPCTRVNAQKNNGRTALLAAVRNGHQAIVNVLLDHPGTDVNVQDQDGHTALSLAAFFGHVSAAKMLLERPDTHVEVPNDKGRTAFMIAAEWGHAPIVKLLLEWHDVPIQQENGQNGSAVTAETDRNWNDKSLPEHTPNVVNSKDNFGNTALALAAKQGDISVPRLLLQHPAIKVDEQDKDGWTALMTAAGFGHTSIVKILLEQTTINVNAQHNEGQTALIVAAELGLGSIVKLLLEHPDTDASLQDNTGRGALYYAAENGQEDVVKLLLNHGGVQIDAREPHGCTPLAIAAEYGHDSIVQLLLQHGNVNVNNVDGDGDTPLIVAGYNGHTTIAKLLLACPDIQVNAQDNRGRRTALSRAAAESRTPAVEGTKSESEALDFVQLLLTRDDIDVNLPDEEGHTPLYHAIQSGFMNVAELLKSKGGIMHREIDITVDNSA